MNLNSASRRFRPIIAALFLGLCVSVLAPASVLAQENGSSASSGKVAVIDVDRLVEESALGKSLREQLSTYQTQVQQRVSQLQQEGTQLTTALQNVRTDSDQARDLRRQIQVKRAQLQAEQQTFQTEVQLSVRSANLVLLRAINEAAAKVARERGIQLVIRKSPPLPESYDPQQNEQFEQTLLRQQTIYVDPGADITSLVLTQMNEDNAGQTPAAGTETPAPAQSAPAAQPE